MGEARYDCGVDGESREHRALQDNEAAGPPAATAPTQSDDLEREVEAMIEAGADPEELAPVVQELEPADAADTLESLEPEASAEVLHVMEDQAAADALAHMEVSLAVTVLLDLEREESARLLSLMEPDDAADILQGLPQDVAKGILSAIEPKQAAVLGKLALYDPETAGGVMTTDILVLREGMTIGQAIQHIKKRPMEESQTEVYVVDADKRLVGTISMRDLLVANNDERVGDYIEREVEMLHPAQDREEVAELFQRYDYITLPVVDEERRILGMVTIDDVVDIIESERSEDAGKLVGAGAGEAVFSSLKVKIRGRTPWLVINLVAAQLGASILLVFHDLIQLIPVVATIYPVIANQAGNTGQQSLAIVLRGLVLDQVRREQVRRLLLRETMVGLLTGVLVGLVFGLSVAALNAMGLLESIDWRMGIVAGVAMTGAMTAACLIGASIPLGLDRLGLDPATASSIFLTMMTDFLSYGVFLALVLVMQGWLTPAAGVAAAGGP